MNTVATTPVSSTSDWPGSPLSTLHRAAGQARLIPVEQYPDCASYIIRLEIPGVDPTHDLTVSVGTGTLSVRAERRNAGPDAVLREREVVMNAEARPTILVGVSGSPASAAALRWSAAEAERRRGRLRIVLIWQPEQRAFYAPPAAPPDRHNRAQHDLDRTLRTVLGSGLPADATAQIVVGVPERALVTQSSSADLLVLGSGSATVIGPVIRACLTGAHCPVVVVGPQAVPAASPRQAKRHIGGRPIHRAHSRRPVAAGAAAAPLCLRLGQ